MTDTGHLAWGAEQVWQQLEPLLPGLSVEVVARAESTNTLLLERARRHGGRRDTPITGPADFDGGPAGIVHARQPDMPYGRRADDTQPCLLVAEHQSRGRGRMGRTWQSSAGASLTFSLALPLQPADWSGMSLAVGVSLADALDPNGARLGLKWPNDLWLLDPAGDGRKLGGVLIETVAVGRRRMTVVGVGLNVLPQPTRDLASGYACLQELDAAIDAPAALHRVALPLVQGLLAFERVGFAGFTERFAARDLLRGRGVATTSPQVPEGVAAGVAPDGALLVRVGDTVHALTSAEVSVRLSDGTQPVPETA